MRPMSGGERGSLADRWLSTRVPVGLGLVMTVIVFVMAGVELCAGLVYGEWIFYAFAAFMAALASWSLAAIVRKVRGQ